MMGSPRSFLRTRKAILMGGVFPLGSPTSAFTTASSSERLAEPGHPDRLRGIAVQRVFIEADREIREGSDVARDIGLRGAARVGPDRKQRDAPHIGHGKYEIAELLLALARCELGVLQDRMARLDARCHEAFGRVGGVGFQRRKHQARANHQESKRAADADVP